MAAVRLFSASYKVENVAGSGAGGDGGPAKAAQFSSLEGVAAARDGTIYIADGAANRVRRIDAAGIIHAYAANAGLRSPYGLAVDVPGNLYIADYGNGRVCRVSTDGTVTTIAAGLKGPRNVAVSNTGVLYIADFDDGKVYQRNADGSLAALEITGLGNPAGIAVDSGGALYIADASGGVVHRYEAGQSEIWVRNLNTPTGVAFSGNEALYVTGASFNYTLARMASGQVVIAGPGGRDVSPDGRGGVLVAAGAQLLHILASGATETLAGTTVAPSGPTLAKDATLNGPIGIATDSKGNLYIAEEQGARIRRVDVAGLISTLVDGTNIQDPVAIATTPSGGLIVAEYQPQRVRAVSARGAVTTLLAAPSVSRPRGVAMDPLGNWYVADAEANRVIRISAAGTLSIVGEGFLVRPSAVALEASGALLVADSGHHLVRRYEPATGNWRTLAGTAEAGSAGDGGLASLAQLNFPAGLASTTDGSLYIADTYNHRVRRIAPDGIIETIAGAPELDTPSGIAIGAAGEIYVADLGHNRVVRLVPVPDAEPEPDAPEGTGLPVVPLRILHAATGNVEPLAPGQLFAISGVGFGGSELYLNGRETPIFELLDSLAYAVVPSTAAGVLTVEVRNAGQTVGVGGASVVTSAPALFVDPPTGRVLVSGTRGTSGSFIRGEVVSVYGTGEGLTPDSIRLVLIPPTDEGQVAVDAEVVYVGRAAGEPGVLRIDARIPRDLPPGEMPIEFRVGENRGTGLARARIE